MSVNKPTKNAHRRRRRKPIPNFVGRLIGGVLGGLLAASLVLPLYNSLAQPYRLGVEVGTEVAVLKQRLDQKHQESARLRQRIVFLKSPEGMEALARQYGYHQPGEEVYLMPRETSQRADTAPPEKP
jgi:cell division protein FtsB